MNIGDKIKIEEVDYFYSEVTEKEGIVTDIKTKYIVVQFKNYKECFRKADIRNSKGIQIYIKKENEWVNAKDEFKGEFRTVEDILKEEKARELKGGWRDKEKKVICIEKWKVYSSVKECAEDVGANASNISAVCRGERTTCKGYTFMYYSDFMKNGGKPKGKRKVICLNTGKVYGSVSECARDLQCFKQHVVRACKEHNRTCKGVKLRYYDEYLEYQMPVEGVK